MGIIYSCFCFEYGLSLVMDDLFLPWYAGLLLLLLLLLCSSFFRLSLLLSLSRQPDTFLGMLTCTTQHCKPISTSFLVAPNSKAFIGKI
jgi:hypothetical protein